MESCPHCNFLIRDGSRTCGVCHKPVVVASGQTTFQGFLASDLDAARIGPGRVNGTPFAVVVLLLLVLLFAAGAGVAAFAWP